MRREPRLLFGGNSRKAIHPFLAGPDVSISPVSSVVCYWNIRTGGMDGMLYGELRAKSAAAAHLNECAECRAAWNNGRGR